MSISIVALTKGHPITCLLNYLRVGPGQNGQILFISVEQLSLNVAGDSAKTLSVLGNMGVVVLGVQRIFRKNTEKRPRWRSVILGPICPPVGISTRIYPQDLRTPKKVH